VTLTKEIIEREMRIWERNGYIEGTVWARHYIDLCRLALLGLETEAKLARVDADTGDWFARSYGAFPDLEPDTEPARDTRAERIGRAVLRELSDQGVELPGLRDGYASEGGIIAVIAAAMEDEA
jgi:hypothetical protein